MDILGLFVQVERVFGICQNVFSPIYAYMEGAIMKYSKWPPKNMQLVSALFPIVQCQVCNDIMDQSTANTSFCPPTFPSLAVTGHPAPGGGWPLPHGPSVQCPGVTIAQATSLSSNAFHSFPPGCRDCVQCHEMQLPALQTVNNRTQYLV